MNHLKLCKKRRTSPLPPAPWIVSHFGFNTVADYVNWLDGLSDEALTAHILDLLHLLLGE